MVHGSEMILNPSQQRQLWEMANGSSGKQGNNQPVVLVQNSYNITCHDVEGLRAELYNQRDFLNGMTIEAIQNSSGMRAALRTMT